MQKKRIVITVAIIMILIGVLGLIIIFQEPEKQLNNKSLSVFNGSEMEQWTLTAPVTCIPIMTNGSEIGGYCTVGEITSHEKATVTYTDNRIEGTKYFSILIGEPYDYSRMTYPELRDQLTYDRDHISLQTVKFIKETRTRYSDQFSSPLNIPVDTFILIEDQNPMKTDPYYAGLKHG